MSGFPSNSDGKESACNAGDLDSIPGSGRFPGEGSGNSLQYSCLENPMDSPWGRKRIGQDLATKQQQRKWCSCVLKCIKKNILALMSHES